MSGIIFFASALIFLGALAFCTYKKTIKKTNIAHKKHEEDFLRSLETGLIYP